VEGELVNVEGNTGLEDVLWFPDSSGALLLIHDASTTTVLQIDHQGHVERRLDTPYLSRSSHVNYSLEWEHCEA
jgi:hypothetical protein